MKEIFVILLATALLEQAAVRRAIPDAAREPKAWFLSGCGVLIVLTASAVLTAVLDQYVLQRFGLGAGRFVLMLLLIALFSLGLGRQDVCAGLCDRKTGGAGLTIACSAVLSAALTGTEPGAALKLALGLGAGYALLSFVLAGILNRLDEDAMPAAVRGIPILALCAALIAIALMGFNGFSF